MKKILLCAWLLAQTASLFAQSPLRQTITFNKDWKFTKGNPGRAQERAFDDAAWSAVRLPHDWAIAGPFDPKGSGETGKLPWKGEGWYRKTFETNPEWVGKRVYVLFDGVMAFPKVYINGRLAGTWDYGYNSFYLDITAYLIPGEKNVMAVYVDTRSHDSRWYPGAGIYRKVQLIVTNPVHTALWGTYVTTPEIDANTARTRIQTTVLNTDEGVKEVTVQQTIIDQQGKNLASATAVSRLKPGASHVFDQSMRIGQPQLWSPEHPTRYTVKTTVVVNGKPCDEYLTPFGIRSIKFTADDGFWLNGSRYPLKGVCLHADFGALGTAFNKRAMERQLEIMRDMGCNAIRTSHNAPAPELLDLCDEMGFLVFDELFDKWENKADFLPGADFESFARRNADNFLRRDRNHPSIFIWSVGNEIAPAQVDFEDGFDKLRTITSLFRSMEPTRPLTMACDIPNGADYRHFDYYDVLSYNYGRRYAMARKAAPDKAVIISESASTLSTRGFYELPLPAKATDFTDALQISSYDLNAPYWAEIPEEDFRWQQEDPFVAGEFVWTGFDYLGEPTPYGDDVVRSGKFKAEQTPRSSYFGIVDLAGIPKDRYYLYRSYWNKEKNTVHILPHWNWPGRVGKNVPVFVYTDGDCAELFLNGKSLGKQCKNTASDNSTERFRLMWKDIVYAPGTLKVVASKNGREIGSAEVRTADAPTQLRLTPDRSRIKADGDDLSFVLVEALDNHGNLCPLADNQLQIAVRGTAVFAAADNGNPLSFAPFQMPEVQLFNGKAMVILRSKEGEKGNCELQLTGKGIATGRANIVTE